MADRSFKYQAKRGRQLLCRHWRYVCKRSDLRISGSRIPSYPTSTSSATSSLYKLCFRGVLLHENTENSYGTPCIYRVLHYISPYFVIKAKTFFFSINLVAVAFFCGLWNMKVLHCLCEPACASASVWVRMCRGLSVHERVCVCVYVYARTPVSVRVCVYNLRTQLLVEFRQYYSTIGEDSGVPVLGK